MKQYMITAAAVLLATGSTADATTFNFTFNDIGGGGTGTLSVEKILTAGTYKLSEVGVFDLNFNAFGRFNYTNSNIRTSASTVLLVVRGEVGSLTMLFSNTQQYGDGPREGSLDLIGNRNFMSFVAPGGVSSLGPNFYTVGPTGQRPFIATYSAVEAPVAPVPEAPIWAMMLAGFGLIGGAIRYRRRGMSVRYA